MFLLGFKAKPGNFQIFGASDERFHIAGGNQQLPETMASYLTGTGLTTIATGSRMNTIALNSNGTVSLWFDGSKSPVVYDQVILDDELLGAAHARLLEGRIRPAQADGDHAARLGTQRASCSSSSTRATGTRPAPGASRTVTSTPTSASRTTWDVTRAQPYAKGILVNYTGGSIAGGVQALDAVLERVDEQAGHDVREGVPEAARDGLPRDHAALERPGDPVDPVPRPEPALLVRVLARRAVHEVQRLRGSAAGPRGQIHFAGEHCSQDFQGFMEGGAAEGVRAAKEILGTK